MNVLNVLSHSTSGLSSLHSYPKATVESSVQVKLPSFTFLRYLSNGNFIHRTYGPAVQFFVEATIVSEINGAARNRSSCRRTDPKDFAPFVPVSYTMTTIMVAGFVSIPIQKMASSKLRFEGWILALVSTRFLRPFHARARFSPDSLIVGRN